MLGSGTPGCREHAPPAPPPRRRIFIHPTKPKRRLRRQLSAVINFVRFKEGKEHLYLDAMAKKQRLAAAVAAAQVCTDKRLQLVCM